MAIRDASLSTSGMQWKFVVYLRNLNWKQWLRKQSSELSGWDMLTDILTYIFEFLILALKHFFLGF